MQCSRLVALKHLESPRFNFGAAKLCSPPLTHHLSWSIQNRGLNATTMKRCPMIAIVGTKLLNIARARDNMWGGMASSTRDANRTRLSGGLLMMGLVAISHTRDVQEDGSFTLLLTTERQQPSAAEANAKMAKKKLQRAIQCLVIPFARCRCPIRM